MKRRVIIIFILLTILISGCTVKEEVPDKKDKPNKKVPQTDEFNDPYGSDKKKKKTVDENDDLIGE
ncbi:hypothetical protein [Sporohalobacter salinus]|uniref:hypothetical protein n=1 Tax=Sporohalobacter salinus TaxID=1494606 RepID=UPI00195FCAA3|nr:hypothetical protein [Sporohalobacter salinus]MBM7624202.1 PBP1b-binding outer membrane lipoprotein LpoB [Sporohalobacter salinus]